MTDQEYHEIVDPEWNMKPQFVVLEGIKHGNRFFSTNWGGSDPRYLLDGSLGYRILGYADTTEEAQIILFGKSSTKKPDFGLIFETPTMKVERFPEGVHISLSLGNGGYLVCGISRKDAIKLGDILLDDPHLHSVMKG